MAGWARNDTINRITTRLIFFFNFSTRLTPTRNWSLRSSWLALLYIQFYRKVQHFFLCAFILHLIFFFLFYCKWGSESSHERNVNIFTTNIDSELEEIDVRLIMIVDDNTLLCCLLLPSRQSNVWESLRFTLTDESQSCSHVVSVVCKCFFSAEKEAKIPQNCASSSFVSTQNCTHNVTHSIIVRLFKLSVSSRRGGGKVIFTDLLT